MIGTKLANYEIISHMGTGGMGEVYQATDSRLGRSDRRLDGKRFVVAIPPQSNSKGEPKPSVHFTFLVNFFDEVRRRVPLQ